MNIPDELLIEGIARAMAAWLREPETAERVAHHLAAAQKSELMTTAEAAEMLGVSTKTFRENREEWGITMSVALGMTQREGDDGVTAQPTAPRFYRSQIMERMRAKEMKGRKSEAAKVTNFPPQKRPQQKAS